MGASETVQVTGHLMDSGILSRVLDDIRDYGCDYTIDQLDVGHDAHDQSSARITVEAEDDAALQRLLMRLQTRGVNQVDPGFAVTAAAERDGVLPDGFYATTNLATRVRLDGRWLVVENPEMDCGLVVEQDGTGVRARTVPMCDVLAGMEVIVGAAGVQVDPPRADAAGDVFGVFDGDGSGDRPQAVLVRQVADAMRQVRAGGREVLWVAGPGVVHTGAVPAMVALVEAGFVDVLFAGNALAVQDVEAALYGTGIGLDPSLGQGVQHGHEHHVRALNTMRKAGSISAAVESGVLTDGIMHAMGLRFGSETHIETVTGIGVFDRTGHFVSVRY